VALRALAFSSKIRPHPARVSASRWSWASWASVLTPAHLRRRVFIEAGSARPDAAGQEEFESPGVGRYRYDRYRGLLGPVKVQGIDRRDARKFRLRRVPRVMHPARRRSRDW
jgi:hypothetical protein